MCQDVYEIDIIEAEDMTKELFENRYDFSGRPVLVKNVTAHWTAMQEFNFEFFRDLYEDLQSPVLDNEDPDCQFLSWGFNFENVQVSSSDNLLPYLLLFEDGNRHIVPQCGNFMIFFFYLRFYVKSIFGILHTSAKSAILTDFQVLTFDFY